MFQFLTILLAVTAVVTKAVPLTDHDDLLLQQQNVRQLQTEEKKVDLGNISAPAYIMDLFTNISNKQARQNQVLSKDDLVNVVRSFPNLVTGKYCGPAGCFYYTVCIVSTKLHTHCSLFPPSGHCGRLGFNISIMSSTEIVVKAKLRVRVDKAGYTGRMLAVLFHANQTMITEMEVTSDWVEFSIDTIVATWAKYTNHIQHDFIVELYSMDTLSSAATDRQTFCRKW